MHHLVEFVLILEELYSSQIAWPMVKNSGLFKEENSPPQSTINLDSGLAPRNTHFSWSSRFLFNKIKPCKHYTCCLFCFCYFISNECHMMLSSVSHSIVFICDRCVSILIMLPFLQVVKMADDWRDACSRLFDVLLLINFNRHDFIYKWVQKPNTAVVKYLALKPTNFVTTCLMKTQWTMRLYNYGFLPKGIHTHLNAPSQNIPSGPAAAKSPISPLL